MIIYASSVEVVVYVLRRFPEINSPESLRRMIQAMAVQSDSYHGLAKQVVAHAGNLAGVETGMAPDVDTREVRFYVPPGVPETQRAWMVGLRSITKVNPDGIETHNFQIHIRHDNPQRDVRVLAAALLAEDEQKCTITVGDTSQHVQNLIYALQKALIRL